MIKPKPFKIFFAAIFSLALLFPIAIQSIHALEGHEHEVCHDFSTHIHTKQLDCSIYDFHFSIFDFKPQQLPEFTVLEGYIQTDSNYQQAAIIVDAPHFFLRGPPATA